MIAYLNGNFLPLDQCALPIWDYGFTMGVTLSEQVRTYRRKLPLLPLHLERLSQGLSVVGIDPELSSAELGEIVHQLVDRNLAYLDAEQELGIGLAITAGTHDARAPRGWIDKRRCSIVVSALPLLPIPRDQLEPGVRLVTVQTRDIPDRCVPRELKCRSRMHYYLAELEAARCSVGARPILQDLDGFITEGTTHSLLAVVDNTIVSPAPGSVLPSVSVRFVQETLCPRLGLVFEQRPLHLESLLDSDELLWLNSPTCVLPVAELNGQKLSNSLSKPVFRRLIEAWSQVVGVDLMSSNFA